MELFAEEAAGFECQATPLTGPVTDNRERSCQHMNAHRRNKAGQIKGTGRWWSKAFSTLLVIDHFHLAVLLDPKLAHDDVVDTAGWVCPGVRLVMPTQRGEREERVKGSNSVTALGLITSKHKCLSQ